MDFMRNNIIQQMNFIIYKLTPSEIRVPPENHRSQVHSGRPKETFIMKMAGLWGKLDGHFQQIGQILLDGHER